MSRRNKRKENTPTVEHGAATHTKQNPTHNTVPAIVEKKDTSPTNPTAKSNNWNAEERSFHRWYLRSQWALVCITIGGIAVAIGSLRNLSRSVNAAKQSNILTQQIFQTGQRAYVFLGAENGKAVEFRDVPNSDVPLIVLHFFNSGSSVARHFAVHAYGLFPGATLPMNTMHRHRYRIPASTVLHSPNVIVGDTIFTVEGGLGYKSDTVAGGLWDIGAKTAKDEIISDSRSRISRSLLDDPATHFSIVGDFEYCDIFGQFHCQGFIFKYIPPPVDDFIQTIGHDCFVEELKPQDVKFPNVGINGLPSAATELAACEQPNEREYTDQKELKDNLASSLN
jgi:hypothetical protein